MTTVTRQWITSFIEGGTMGGPDYSRNPAAPAQGAGGTPYTS